MVQFFKPNDEDERKAFNAVESLSDILSGFKDDFFEGAYGATALGEILFDGAYMPLTNAIRREIFIDAFKELFEAWSFSGTHQTYVEVFKKIFGEDVELDFTVPDPGKLVIDITATGFQLFDFLVKEIVDNEYVDSTIVDHEGDTIIFSSPKGFETQQETQTMVFTMVPNGIFTTVSLTLGDD